MVVLTLVAETNGQVFRFDESIPKVHFMQLLSCSLYNSCNTLKNKNSASLGGKKMMSLYLLLNCPPGITCTEFPKKCSLIGRVPRPVITATDHVTVHFIICVQVQVQIVQGRVGIGLCGFHSFFGLLFGFLFDTLDVISVCKS